MNKSILKAYSTSLLGIGSGLITQLVFIRELSRSVDLMEFSLYGFAFQIVTYLNLLQLGIDFSTSREISLRLGQLDYAGAKQSFTYIKKFNKRITLLGLFLILSCTLIINFNVKLFKNFNVLDATVLVILFGIGILISFLSNPFIVALIGSNFQDKVNINNILITICTSLFAFVLIKMTSLGIFAMPLSLILFNSINFFLLKAKSTKYCRVWLDIEEENHSNKQYHKHILSFSLLATIGGMAWTIESTSDVFLLTFTGKLSLVAFYILWWRFPQMFFDLATRLTTSSLPTINQLIGRSSTEAIPFFNKLMLLVGCLAFCIQIGLAKCLPSFIKLWVGERFLVTNMQNIAFLISFLIYTRIVGNCLSMYIISLGKIVFSSILSVIQAVIKVVLGLFFVNKYGLEGLLVSSIISSLIQTISISFLLIKVKHLRLDIIFVIIIAALLAIVSMKLTLNYPLPFFQFIFFVLICLISSIIIWFLIMKIFIRDKSVQLGIVDFGFKNNPR